MDAGMNAPEWVTKRVLPQVEGRVRGVQMLDPNTALVFAGAEATLAHKGAFGVKVLKAAYPTGLLVNESRCPHCHELIVEPVAKVAHLAEKPKKELSPKQIAQRKYAAEMRTLRERARKSKGGSGPIRSRSAAKKLRSKHGLKD